MYHHQNLPLVQVVIRQYHYQGLKANQVSPFTRTTKVLYNLSPCNEYNKLFKIAQSTQSLALETRKYNGTFGLIKLNNFGNVRAQCRVLNNKLTTAVVP